GQSDGTAPGLAPSSRPRIEARRKPAVDAGALDRFAMTTYDHHDSTGASGSWLRPTGDQRHRRKDDQRNQQRQNRAEQFHGCGASMIAGLRLSALAATFRSEEHTSELQSRVDLVCRLLLEKKK